LRQRKDNTGQKWYSISTMNDNFDISETSVENFLKSTPKAVRFFLDGHTSCVGCGFSRFCTLKDVINTYRLDEKDFLEKLAKITAQKH
jgi:succinylglutamate desuccinylase